MSVSHTSEVLPARFFSNRQTQKCSGAPWCTDEYIKLHHSALMIYIIKACLLLELINDLERIYGIKQRKRTKIGDQSLVTALNAP